MTVTEWCFSSRARGKSPLCFLEHNVTLLTLPPSWGVTASAWGLASRGSWSPAWNRLQGVQLQHKGRLKAQRLILFGGLPRRDPSPLLERKRGSGWQRCASFREGSCPHTSRTLTADDSNWRARRCQLGASLGKAFGPPGSWK